MNLRLSQALFCSLLFIGSVPMAAAEASGARFTVMGPSVFDGRTGLTWQRCSIGQQWHDNRCIGDIKLINWREAQKFAGGEWRLPTKNELETLVDQDRKRRNLAPFIDVSVFPDVRGNTPQIENTLFYWTSRKGIANCFAVAFGEESRSDALNGGFIYCNYNAARRLVKGKPAPRGRPWAE